MINDWNTSFFFFISPTYFSYRIGSFTLATIVNCKQILHYGISSGLGPKYLKPLTTFGYISANSLKTSESFSLTLTCKRNRPPTLLVESSLKVFRRLEGVWFLFKPLIFGDVISGRVILVFIIVVTIVHLYSPYSPLWSSCLTIIVIYRYSTNKTNILV